MAKIELDKYYTPKDLAEYCVNKTKEIIGEENIIEWLEPSAGCGNFLDYLGIIIWLMTYHLKMIELLNKII